MRRYLFLSVLLLVSRIGAADEYTLKLVQRILSDMNNTLQRDMMALKAQLALTNANLSALRTSLMADWVKIGSTKVKVFSDELDWDSANNACQAFPSHLIRIVGSKQNKDLTNLLAKHADSTMYWIGEKMQLDFSADKRFNKYVPATRCIAINRKGSWVGRDCAEKMPFICAIK